MLAALNEFNPILLIAVPQLVDPFFRHSVILVLRHDQNGAFGFILNHPMNFQMAEFAQNQQIICHPRLLDQEVYGGGPLEPQRGWILHAEGDIEEKYELFPGLYVSGSMETLRFFMENGRQPFRFVLGYSGWQASQLEQEMQQGSWITVPLDTRYIFYKNSGDMWDATLHDMGVDPARLAQGHGIH